MMGKVVIYLNFNKAFDMVFENIFVNEEVWSEWADNYTVRYQLGYLNVDQKLPKYLREFSQ